MLGINYLLVRAALPDPVPQGSDTGGLVPDVSTGSRVEQLTVEEYRSDVLNTLLVQSGVTLAVTAATALVLGRIAANRMLRPVQEVVSTARRLSADSLDERIRMQGPRDELTELADTFDEMLDRLATSFDSQRRFVANASHELRTPLATQRTMVEVAMARPHASSSMRDLCERLLVMNARSEALIEGLLVLASSDRGLAAKHAVRLDEVVEQVVDAYRKTMRCNGIRLHMETSARIVQGDRVLLERLVSNLVDNAIKYNSAGEIGVRVADEPAVEVSNTGPVVPSAAVETLFEPFVCLRRERQGPNRGVGLGLSIVASITRAHGGSVAATPRDGGGLIVSVSLPC